MTRKIPKIRID